MKKIFIIFCLTFSFGAHAVSELAQIKSQIAKTEQQDKILDKKVKSSQRDVEQTKKKLVNAADKVSTLETERGAVSKKISQLDIRREQLLASLTANRANIANTAASILFISSHPNFDSENMHEYVLTSALLSGMSQQFDSEIQTATKQIEELEQVISERATQKEKLDRTAKKYTAEKNDLDKLLRVRSAQNEKLVNQQQELKKKLRLLSDRAKNISELSAGVGSSKMSSDTHFSIRKLTAPVHGRLVSRFGEKTASGLESDGWRIKTDDDALVVAPADGKVKFADTFRGFGRVLILSHKNGYNTVMTNFGELDVLLDQEVLAGEPVGRMDPDKSEMYLEVRRGNHVVDPSRLFNEP